MKIFESGLIVVGIFYLHEVAAQTGQKAAQVQQQRAAQVQQSVAQVQQSAAQIPLVPNAAQIGQSPALIPTGQIRQSAAQLPIQQIRRTGAQFPIQQIRQSAAQLPIQQIRRTGAQLPIQQIRQSAAQLPIQQIRQSAAHLPIQQIRHTAVQFPIQQSRQTAAQVPIHQIRQSAAQFPIQQSRQSAAQVPIQQIRQSAAQAPIQQIRQAAAQVPIQQIRQSAAQLPIQQFRQTGAQFPLGQITQTGVQSGQIQQTGFQGPLGPYGPLSGQVSSRRSNFGRLSLEDCQTKSIDSSSDSKSVSAEAKKVGLSIADTLDGLMRDKSSGDSAIPPDYYKALDFQFILDSSGSIGACEFLAAKDASKVVAKYINERVLISSTGSRVGLIEFSSPDMTHVMFRFGDHESLKAVTDAIDSISYDRGSTSTAIALNLAKTEFEQNGKVGHAKVAWVLTDGKSNTGGDPIPVARQLKKMDVTVCAVAIGRNVNMIEINGIATKGCVFQLPSFSTYREANKYAFKQKFGAKSAAQRKGKAG